MANKHFVIPAQAGTHCRVPESRWVPAPD